jgi:hypothetical protein
MKMGVHLQNIGYHTTQHEAVTEQFAQTLEEKDRKVASLQHQIKLLLQRISERMGTELLLKG